MCDKKNLINYASGMIENLMNYETGSNFICHSSEHVCVLYAVSDCKWNGKKMFCSSISQSPYLPWLTIACWEILHAYAYCFLLLIFFSETIRVSNSLDPDQARHFVGPDLGPNCLQSLSSEDTSLQRVNNETFTLKWKKLVQVFGSVMGGGEHIFMLSQ